MTVERTRGLEVLSPEEKVRLAVTDYVILCAAQGGDPHRLTQPGMVGELVDVVYRWTGVHPQSFRGGPAIVYDQLEQLLSPETVD